MRRHFPTVTALGLAALLGACQPAPAPTPTPTPAPTPTPDQYTGKTTHITLLEFATPKGCAIVAIPYYAYVREGGAIVWDVVNDACPLPAAPKIEFREPDIVEIGYDDKAAAAGGVKTSVKATVKAHASDKPHHYTVTLGKFVHDPEIEIWP